MSETDRGSDAARLRRIAVDAMREHGLEPDFPPDALAETNAVPGPPTVSDEPLQDLRSLLWCSIDDDASRDLDQLSVADPHQDGSMRLLVAVADVDSVVRKGMALDRHAGTNTTSVYTPAVIFPMLPERLSTDLTSLADAQDRIALIIDMLVAPDGTLSKAEVYGARVRNRAKLAYRGVDAWLTGTGPLPAAAASVSGMDEQLRIQDRAAQLLSKVRHEHGALDFQSTELEPVFDADGGLSDLRPQEAARARALIENLMVAANGAVARFLMASNSPSIRRVVKTPARWDRIVELASAKGTTLPAQPDARALAGFLSAEQHTDPDHFEELSHSVLKLLGSGEYVVERPGGDAPGHFALAVKDYTHSTAPNRRYPDLVTQRLVKAVLAGKPAPYTEAELESVAARCTMCEDAANKIERQVRKSAAALLMQSRIGDRFEGVVTGASDKGTWVRLSDMHVEGRLVRGAQGLDVGDRVRVRLVEVDVDRGFIDLARD